MKRLIWATAGLVVLTAFGFYVYPPTRLTASRQKTAVESNPIRTAGDPQPVKTVGAPPEQSQYNNARESAGITDTIAMRSSQSNESPVTAATTLAVRPVVSQAIETLVSSHATFEQKQAMWKQLKDTGKLDEAIGKLEERAANNPQSAEDTATLGEAYWEKCRQISDIREKAILVMKADELFDAALNVDSSNWEARYTKAVAMSYWPAELNKGQEVIEQFTTLIQQQETQPPQPQFAQAYVRLGDQYLKTGQSDYATQVWERGASFFPDNQELRKRLTPAP